MHPELMKVLQVCAQTEERAGRQRAEAARQRDAALARVRERSQGERQAADQVLYDTRERCRRAQQVADQVRDDALAQLRAGDRLLQELGLSRRGSAVAPMSVPDGDIDKLGRSLRNHCSDARVIVNQLQQIARMLTERRKQWWKIW